MALAGIVFTMAGYSPPVLAQAVATQSGKAGEVELGTVLVQASGSLEDQRAEEDPNGPGFGYVANRTTAGSKTNAALVEIPQSISVVTRQQMENLASPDVNKALRYTPGIVSETRGTVSNGGGGFGMMLRGFRPDFYLDGLKMDMGGISYGMEVVDPYLLDRIEVISGPASVLYGQATPGGLVNLVSKRPTSERIREVQMSAGNYDRYRMGFDLGGALDKEGNVLYRLTGVGVSEGNQIDYLHTKRVAIAPSLSWKISPDTKVTFLAQYSRSPDTGTSAQLPAYGTVLPHAAGRIPTSFNLSDPAFDSNSQTTAFLGYEFEHRLSSATYFKQSLRYGTSKADGQRLALPGNLPTPNVGTVLDRRSVVSTDDVTRFTLDNQLGTTLKFSGMSADLLAGVDYQKYHGSTLFQQANARPIDFVRPVYGISAPNIAPVNRFQADDFDNEQLGIYGQAILKTGGWNAMLGGRYDNAKMHSATRRAANGAPVESDAKDSQFTGRAGLMYAFDNGVSPYISYSTSFVPLAGTDFYGSPFKPTSGKQAEAGLKFQPKGFDGLFTASVYNLKQENVKVNDPVHQGASIQTGEVQVKGLELSARANLTKSLSVIASYTYADAENSKSTNSNPGIDGAMRPIQGSALASVPKNTAALLVDYAFRSGPLTGLAINGGARYIGSAPGDSPQTFNVPGFTLFDLGARYDLGRANPAWRGTTLQINVSNLFDKTYAAGCTNAAFCFWGSRRSVTATATYRW